MRYKRLKYRVYERAFLYERFLRATKRFSGDFYPAKDKIYRSDCIMARIPMVFHGDCAYVGEDFAYHGQRIKDVNSRYNSIRRRISKFQISRFARVFRGLDRLISAFSTSGMSSGIYIEPFYGLVLDRNLAYARASQGDNYATLYSERGDIRSALTYSGQSTYKRAFIN